MCITHAYYNRVTPRKPVRIRDGSLIPYKMQQTEEIRACRACMGTDVDGQLHELQEKGLVEMFQQVTSLRLSASDGTPHHICSFCRALLLKAHQFRLKCLETDKIWSQNAGSLNCVRNVEKTSVMHKLSVTDVYVVAFPRENEDAKDIDQPDSQVVTMGHHVAVKEEQADIDHLQNDDGHILDEPVNKNPVISYDEIHIANTSNHAYHGVNELSMAIDPTTVVKTELLDIKDEVLTPAVELDENLESSDSHDVSNEEPVPNTEVDLLQKVEEDVNGMAHIATANGARPYPCGQCGKAYKMLAALKQHHRRVHDRPTICDQSQTTELSVDKGKHVQEPVPYSDPLGNLTSNVASAKMDKVSRISPFANFSPFPLFSPFSPFSPFPPLSPEDMEEWFTRIEYLFNMSGISSDNTKFYYVTGQLTPQYANEVSDIIISPPASDKFSILKSELIKRLSSYHERKLEVLLEDLGHQEAPKFLPSDPQVEKSRREVLQVGEWRGGVPQVGESRSGVPQVEEWRGRVPKVEWMDDVPQVDEWRGEVPQNAAVSSGTFMDANKSAYSLQCHSARSSNARPYPCERCDETFKWQSMLTKHLRSVHNSRKLRFGCDDCGKRFKSKTAVRGHIVSVHSQARPYSCAQCGKTFKWMITLMSHQRAHADDWPVDDCGNTDQINGSLRTDTQTQTDMNESSKREIRKRKCKK